MSDNWPTAKQIVEINELAEKNGSISYLSFQSEYKKCTGSLFSYDMFIAHHSDIKQIWCPILLAAALRVFNRETTGLKCECGSDAVGNPRHSAYCPKY